MRILLISGQKHKGNTYQMATNLLNELKKDIEIELDQLFLPTEGLSYCTGCNNCLLKGERFCPSYETVQSIKDKFQKADIILIISPTYVYSMTSQLKTMFEHLAYSWLLHRPIKQFFNKSVVVFSTSAGLGSKNAIKSIKRNLNWLGISKVYTLNLNMFCLKFEDLTENQKCRLAKKIKIINNKLLRNFTSTKMSIKVFIYYTIAKTLQKKNLMSKIDNRYWQENNLWRIK